MRSRASIAVMILLVVGVLSHVCDVRQVRGAPSVWTVDDDGVADFHTIQEAIDAASGGDVILVRNGTYFEQLVVNKAVSLVGENRFGTIVDGNMEQLSIPVVGIVSNNVTLRGFTVQNRGFGTVGIECYRVSYCNISDNVVTANGNGIYLHGLCTYNVISSNMITNNTHGIGSYGYVAYGQPSRNQWVGNTVALNHETGMYISTHGSSFDVVADNLIMKNKYGLRFCDENGVLVTGNTFLNNTYRFVLDYWESGCMQGGNIIYHNNFIGGSTVLPWGNHYVHTWDDGYPSGGNYWSDYSGCDLYSGALQNELGSDGIGDSPYIIDSTNADNFPLMKPWGFKPPAMNVSVNVDPDTLNLKSNGQWMTAYITLPEGYSMGDIVLQTVHLSGIQALWSEIQDGVYMAKFDRAMVQGVLTSELDYEVALKCYYITLAVTGELVNGIVFEGSDIIRVLDK